MIRFSGIFAVAFLIAALAQAERNAQAQNITGSVQKTGKRITQRGEVILLRGFGDVFSRGLDQIGGKLRTRGIKARVTNHQQWKSVADEIVKNRRRYGRRPVVLIGHSLGANAAIRVAEHLKKNRIRVDYIATFAATNPRPVPSNVRRITNYFFKTGGWGKALKRGPGFRGRLKNIDFSNNKSVGHFNIDKQPNLQRQVIRNILRHVAPDVRSKLSRETGQRKTNSSPTG